MEMGPRTTQYMVDGDIITISDERGEYARIEIVEMQPGPPIVAKVVVTLRQITGSLSHP